MLTNVGIAAIALGASLLQSVSGFGFGIVFMALTPLFIPYYITSCNNETTDIEQTVVAKPNTKIIRNGQLLIEYNGMYYNTLGQPVKH